MRVVSARQTPKDFSVRLSSLKKEYHYSLSFGHFEDPIRRRFFGHVHATLDVPLMSQAARAFVGRHDFRSFSNEGSTGGLGTLGTVRTIHKCCIHPVEGGLRIEVRCSCDVCRCSQMLCTIDIDTGQTR